MMKPYVMRLEQVCKCIEEGRTILLEINPNRPDIDICSWEPIALAKLNVNDNQFVGYKSLYSKPVTIIGYDKKQDVYNVHPGIKLTTYGSAWRCWDAGIPTDEQLKNTRWKYMARDF